MEGVVMMIGLRSQIAVRYNWIHGYGGRRLGGKQNAAGGQQAIIDAIRTF